MAVTPPRPLAEGDDRNLFDCGRESLNIWFRRHAWANQTSGASRINIITDAASGRIVGYVTLSAAQIERAFLPRPQQRNRPDPVPVTLLGQLAVDKDYQGQGHAASLLLFALKTALTAAWASSRIHLMTTCGASMRDGDLKTCPSIPAAPWWCACSTYNEFSSARSRRAAFGRRCATSTHSGALFRT